MDIDKIFSLIDKAEKSSFNRINIETEDVKLSLERSGGELVPVQQAAPTPANAPQEKTPAKQHEHDSDDLVFAPISGVFYVAKEPGAEPFVKEGKRVAKGDVLCIIEAMKTMNEICASRDGVIESVLKKDAEPIVAKDALFKFAKEK